MQSQSRFRAIVLNPDVPGDPEKVIIPAFKHIVDFSKQAVELDRFKKMGQQYYLQDKIHSLVEAAQEKEEKIEDASTMALMTQGLSELNAPTHSYEIYFVRKIKDINPVDIDGVAIVIAGEGRRRIAYIISNNKFFEEKRRCCPTLFCKEREMWNWNFTLTTSQFAALRNMEFNKSNRCCPSDITPARVTMQNYDVINQIKRNVCQAADWIYVGSNSHMEDIYITDRNRRPCRIFGTSLPYLIRITAILNLGTEFILNLGFMNAMENPLFPPDVSISTNSTTGNSTVTVTPNPGLRIFNMTESALGMAMSLFFIFFGARRRATGGMGVQLDDFFIGAYRWLHRKLCTAKPQPGSACCKCHCTGAGLGLSILKNTFNILIFNQMLMMGYLSYLNIKNMTDAIDQQPNPMFSTTVIRDVSIIQWAISLLEEPMMFISESRMITYILENYLRPANFLHSINQLAKSAREEKKEEKVGEQKHFAKIEEDRIDILPSTVLPVSDVKNIQTARPRATSPAPSSSWLCCWRNRRKPLFNSSDLEDDAIPSLKTALVG